MIIYIKGQRRVRFKQVLKALGVALLGFFYDVRISKKGRVSLRLRDNRRDYRNYNHIRRKIRG